MGKENLANTYSRNGVIFEKGIGSKVYDSEGKEYIDFVAGVAVNCLGHSHPSIIKAICEQSNTLMHISNLYYNDKQIQLAQKLAFYSDHHQVFFCNSGSEAVEAALKLARKRGKKLGSPKKNKILYMENSFHGRTLGSLAVTGQYKYQKDFMPLMEGVISCKFNDIEDFNEKMNEEICAVILEPIQGEGGIILAQEDFLKSVREKCDENDAVLIFDEVQCGIGRIGSFFAYQSFETIPDIICMAKGLGGGFPIGAMLASEAVGKYFEPGDHGSTFGGNPLACAVSLAVIEELMDKGIVESIEAKSEYLKNKLLELDKDKKILKGVVGKGLLMGIKLDTDKGEFIKRCFENGLLLVGAGEDVVRILPPLNVDKEVIDEAVGIISKVLGEKC